jgi:hypothetical protein
MKPLDKSDPANQLRALRWALGRNFKPMPADELADLINIPPVAIRAVESRRRKLNENDLTNIELFLGVVWNPELEEWVSVDDRTPFTRDKYEFYLEHGIRGLDPESMRAAYHRMVDLYLDRLEPKETRLIASTKMTVALTKLYRELRRIAAQDDITLGGTLNSKNPKKNPEIKRVPNRADRANPPKVSRKVERRAMLPENKDARQNSFCQ